MAEPKRQRFKIKSTINEHLIPEIGTFGEVWHARAENSIWYATRDGLVVSLFDVLENVPAHTPPRAGRDGIDGASVKGERGPAGPAGIGAPGPRGEKGDSIVGPQGASIKGERGERGPAGPDTAEAVAESKAAVAALRAKVADIAFQCKALRDANVKGSEYIQWLRERAASRLKGNK